MPPRSTSPTFGGKTANALAQARHREKKKQHIAQLEEQVARLQEENDDLRSSQQGETTIRRSSSSASSFLLLPPSSSSSSAVNKDLQLEELKTYISLLEVKIASSALPLPRPATLSSRPSTSPRTTRRSAGGRGASTERTASPASNSSSSSSGSTSSPTKKSKRSADESWKEPSSSKKGKGKRTTSGEDEEDASRGEWPSESKTKSKERESSGKRSSGSTDADVNGIAGIAAGTGWTVENWWSAIPGTGGANVGDATQNPLLLPSNSFFPLTTLATSYPPEHPLFHPTVTIPSHTNPMRITSFPPPSASRSDSQPSFTSWAGSESMYAPSLVDEAKGTRGRVRLEWERGVVQAAAAMAEATSCPGGASVSQLEAGVNAQIGLSGTADILQPLIPNSFASTSIPRSILPFPPSAHPPSSQQLQSSYQPPNFHFNDSLSSASSSSLFPEPPLPKRSSSMSSASSLNVNLPPIDLSSPHALGHLPTFTLPGIRNNVRSRSDGSGSGSTPGSLNNESPREGMGGLVV